MQIRGTSYVVYFFPDLREKHISQYMRYRRRRAALLLDTTWKTTESSGFRIRHAINMMEMWFGYDLPPPIGPPFAAIAKNKSVLVRRLKRIHSPSGSGKRGEYVAFPSLSTLRRCVELYQHQNSASYQSTPLAPAARVGRNEHSPLAAAAFNSAWSFFNLSWNALSSYSLAPSIHTAG